MSRLSLTRNIENGNAAQGYEVVVTGHSLGGCCAELIALKLRALGEERGSVRGPLSATPHPPLAASSNRF
jgi:hypothetical protein